MSFEFRFDDIGELRVVDIDSLFLKHRPPGFTSHVDYLLFIDFYHLDEFTSQLQKLIRLLLGDIVYCDESIIVHGFDYTRSERSYAADSVDQMVL